MFVAKTNMRIALSNTSPLTELSSSLLKDWIVNRK